MVMSQGAAVARCSASAQAMTATVTTAAVNAAPTLNVVTSKWASISDLRSWRLNGVSTLLDPSFSAAD